MEITKLIELAVQTLKESKYTSSRIYMYRWLWSKGVVPFMKARGLNDYNEDVGKDFMLTCHDSGEVSFHHRDLAKSADVLTNVLLKGEVGGRMCHKAVYPLEGEIGDAAKLFIEALGNKLLKAGTLRNYRKTLSNFVVYLQRKGIVTFRDVSEKDIVDYISQREYRQIQYVYSVRRFLAFASTAGLAKNDWTYTIKALGKKFKHKRTPSFYAPEEIRQLEESISRNSNIGKRAYAIVMLCSRLGLRVSDVANLEFSNIDWETSTINIVQFKTGKPLTLPLLPEVGNAIIDYLQFGRKESDCKKIFTSLRPPYEDMTPSSVHNVIITCFQKSGLKFKNRHHGGHSLRFSLAQRMLERSVPIPVIKDTLGHQEADMTRAYLRIDFSQMRQCVMNVPETPDDFYLQKGGCFYE